MAEAVEAAGAAAAAVRAELARTPPAVAVKLVLDWSALDWSADAPQDDSDAAGADGLPGVEPELQQPQQRRRRRRSAAPGEGGGSGGGAGRGAGCRVRVRLRPEPFHEALVATQQVRLPGGASQTPRRLLGGRAGRLQRCSKALSLTWPCI